MKNSYKKVQLSCDDCFNQLYYLESILTLTKESFLEKEFSANYYDLPQKYKLVLSAERNNCINMLTLALDRVSNIKKISTIIEREIVNL